MRDLAKHAHTPEGSTYYYFPGGKQQLAAEAVRFQGEQACRVIAEGLEEGGPLAGLRAFITVARELVTSTCFQGGCPVLAVAVEGPNGEEVPPALHAAAEVFDKWEGLFARSLERYGVPEDQAAQLGALIISSLEGAVAICRAKRSVEPLNNVAGPLEALVMAALSKEPDGASRCHC